MKQVYIVGSWSFIFGVFSTKEKAQEHKNIRLQQCEKGVYIKKRYNEYGYKIND